MRAHLIVGLVFVSWVLACSTKSSSGGSGGSPARTGGVGGGTVSTGGTSPISGGGGTNAGTGGSPDSASGGVVGSNGGAMGAGGGTVATGGAPLNGGGDRGGAGGGSGGGGTMGSTGASSGGASAAGGATGAGAGGSNATGGAGGGGSGSASVLERNNHPSRDGHFLQPALTKAKAATIARDTGFAGTFTGSMWASPLYLENGPAGKGVFFAVTTGNDVIALDEVTGSVIWMKNIGSSPQSSGAGCGSIHPIGILSTPVIDPQTRTIYVAGAIGTTTIMRHEVHALSVDDGTEKAGWPVDAATANAATASFSVMPQNQRSALSLVGGTLYVAYGGHVGDCGNYHGWVLGISAANPKMSGAWSTGGVGEGIWAAGGMASDGNGVFAMTGNSTAGVATHLDSEEVVRLTGLAAFTRSNANTYFPITWRTMDSADADLGSNSPVYVQVPGATPSSYIVAISKDGHMFLLDSTNLGGMNGHVVDFSVAASGMSIHAVPAAYTTAAGVHVTFSTDTGAMCPTGMANGPMIMSVLIPAGSPPVPRVVWCAALTGPEVTSPIATTTNGSADAIVWYMSNNSLVGVDGDTGATVVTSSDTCTGIRRWTSPIAVKGRIVVGGDGNLCSWSPH